MRLIDAERLQKVLEINFGDIGGANVLRQLIDVQPTVCDIEQIRAEIEFEVDHRTNMLCAEDVFEIIDKYTKGESE